MHVTLRQPVLFIWSLYSKYWISRYSFFCSSKHSRNSRTVCLVFSSLPDTPKSPSAGKQLSFDSHSRKRKHWISQHEQNVTISKNCSSANKLFWPFCSCSASASEPRNRSKAACRRNEGHCVIKQRNTQYRNTKIGMVDRRRGEHGHSNVRK